MNQPRIALMGLLACFITATAFTGTVRAQAGGAPAAVAPTGAAKIAVIDLRKAYFTMAETKTSNDQIKGLQDTLEVKNKSDKRALEDIQTQMNQVKVDSDKHKQLMEDFDEKSLKFDMEEKQIQIQMARQRGHQMKKAFDEISAAVADYAKKNGIDLVLVNSSTELPENVGDMSNQDQLVNLIFGRSTLYVGPKADITDAIVAAVDAAAKAPAAPAGH